MNLLKILIFLKFTEFIKENDLTWIGNLMIGSGKDLANLNHPPIIINHIFKITSKSMKLEIINRKIYKNLFLQKSLFLR